MTKINLKKLPNIAHENRNSDEIKKRLQEGAKEFPSLTVEKTDSSKKRRQCTLSLPEYVADMLWEATKNDRDTTQSSIVMKGLKAIGFDIDDADIVDGRKRK